MTGFMVPLVQCEEFDFCGREMWAQGETTLAVLRRRINHDGWCSHNTGRWGEADYCDLDGCCPFCSSEEAFVGRRIGVYCVPLVLPGPSEERTSQ